MVKIHGKDGLGRPEGCILSGHRTRERINYATYGWRRPARTALSTALPRCLLTRKGSQVQTLSRPPHEREQGYCNSLGLLADGIGGRGRPAVGRALTCLTEHVLFRGRRPGACRSPRSVRPGRPRAVLRDDRVRRARGGALTAVERQSAPAKSAPCRTGRGSSAPGPTQAGQFVTLQVLLYRAALGPQHVRLRTPAATNSSIDSRPGHHPGGVFSAPESTEHKQAWLLYSTEPWSATASQTVTNFRHAQQGADSGPQPPW